VCVECLFFEDTGFQPLAGLISVRQKSGLVVPGHAPASHPAHTAHGIRGQIPESAPWPELPTDGAVPAQTTQTALVATQAARQDARVAEREGAKAPV